jgi:hypothetical protein
MKKYYHATWQDKYLPILRDGIKPGWEGIVYMCDSTEDVLKLMGWRLLSRHEGVEEVEVNGEVVKLPKTTEFDSFYVFEFELDEKDVRESFDHSASFFGGARAWFYEGTISPDQLTNVYEYGAA